MRYGYRITHTAEGVLVELGGLSGNRPQYGRYCFPTLLEAFTFIVGRRGCTLHPEHRSQAAALGVAL